MAILDQQSSTAVETVEVPDVDDLGQVTANAEAGPPRPFEDWPDAPSLWKQPFSAVLWTGRTLFAMASLLVLLATLAAIPVVNILALGLMLSAEGRVARSGRLRDAFPNLAVAERLGTIGLGCWFGLFVVRIVADAAGDAALIAPDSPQAQAWAVGSLLIAWLVGVHLILAIACGGTLASFVRPLRNVRRVLRQLFAGTLWTSATESTLGFLAALPLRRLFWLGLVGFTGTFAWLFLPTALFAALHDITKPGQILLTLLGGLLLIPVLTWVAILQADFAAREDWRAFLDLRRARDLLRRTPLLWLLSVVVLYGFALPLYLFKIAAPPRDALWMMTLIFVVTIYPTRILCGWTYSQAQKRSRRAWWLWSWPMRLAIVPLLAVYLFLVFFTPSIGAEGRRVLFEHHALLLPTPFAR